VEYFLSAKTIAQAIEFRQWPSILNALASVASATGNVQKFNMKRAEPQNAGKATVGS
jgi:hypothetical protein